jgi:aerobic carbon-monoxide dehydrogenase medium subunit
MHPAAFTYHRATSVQDAIGALKSASDAKLLAGGHSLVPAMKLRLNASPLLVDLGGLAELRGIRREGNGFVIGAMTTHREIEYSKELKDGCPLLPEAAALIGDPLVRNRGTIGGSLAHADPAADFPACILALGGQLKIEAAVGARTVAADQFFQGLFATALEAYDVLCEIHVPVRTPGVGMAYEKFPHPASRYAVVGVAAVVTMQGDTCTQASVAVTGATPVATKLTALAAALTGQKLDDAMLNDACSGILAGQELMRDAFASADYRAHLADVLARRAMRRARDQALSRAAR